MARSKRLAAALLPASMMLQNPVAKSGDLFGSCFCRFWFGRNQLAV
jgi:hypothetical protein